MFAAVNGRYSVDRSEPDYVRVASSQNTVYELPTTTPKRPLDVRVGWYLVPQRSSLPGAILRIINRDADDLHIACAIIGLERSASSPGETRTDLGKNYVDLVRLNAGTELRQR